MDMYELDTQSRRGGPLTRLAIAMAVLALVVGLVVETGEMQKTVQQQYSNLIAERVTVDCSLTIRGLERDSKIASVIVSDLVGGRKAEDVGRPVFASEGLVQAAQGWVVGQQDVHITVEAYGSAGAVEEARQTGL